MTKCKKCGHVLVCARCMQAKGGNAKGRRAGFSDPAVRRKALRNREANKRNKRKEPTK